MKKALLIVGHGSKSGDAVAVFQQMVQAVRARGEFDCVEGAHMEMAKPSLDEAVHSFSLQDVDEIIVVPYFLYEGMHIKRDIPEMIDRLKREFPHIDFKIAKPIGFEPALVDIILKRAEGL